MSASAIHPRVSVNLICARNWTIQQHLDFLVPAGIDRISLTSAQLGEGVDHVASLLRENSIEVVCVGGYASPLIDGEAKALAGLAPLLDAAHALASPIAFTVTGRTPPRTPTGEACRRLVDSLGAANAYARERGVRLSIEHSSPATRELGFVCSLGDAIYVAEEADLEITVETQNCWHERNLEAMFRNHAHRFAIVQCSDFVVGEEMRMNRRVPGDGDMPLEWMMGVLLDAGYEGCFDLEFLGPAIEREGYASAIRRGVDWLSERLAAWSV